MKFKVIHKDTDEVVDVYDILYVTRENAFGQYQEPRFLIHDGYSWEVVWASYYKPL